MKAPLRRALLSGLVLPGLGQWGNGQRIKGASFILAALIVVGGLLYQAFDLFLKYFQAIGQLSSPQAMIDPMQVYKTFVIGILHVFALWTALGLVVWTSSALDAYFTAKKRADDKTSADEGKGHGAAG